MPMDLKEFAREVHQNAVEHGFWEGERPIEETFALIHSEWSEALEEYRAGRPMVWYDEERGHKPEGIALELIDGCIRILDFMAHMDMTAKLDLMHEELGLWQTFFPYEKESSIPSMICTLHQKTSEAFTEININGEVDEAIFILRIIVFHIFERLIRNGLDPYALMREKHEYNRTRPYMHGKKS